MTKRQEIEEQETYYPPSPMDVSSYEEEAPALVNNLIPDPTLEGIKNTTQNEKEDRIIADRRIVIDSTDEEDLETCSDSDYVYQTYV